LPRLARRRSDGGADRAAARTEWGGPKPGLCTLRSGEGTKWSASLRPATPPYHGHSRPQRRFTRGRAWQGFARRSAVREGRGLARVIPQALLLDAPWTWPARLRRCAGVSARARANIAGGTSSSSPRPERTGSRQRSSRSPTSTTLGRRARRRPARMFDSRRSRGDRKEQHDHRLVPGSGPSRHAPGRARACRRRQARVAPHRESP
jgi:hypothetical protein